MTRRDYNKQETIHTIRSVFLEQCAEGGMEHISVAKLCQACGIAKSTFYLYFDDKFAVLESIENDLLGTLRDICFDLRDIDMDDVFRGRPLEKAIATVRFLRENADTFRVLLGRYGDPRFTYKWKRDIEDSFLDRFRAEKRNERSADIACTIFSSSLVGLYTHILFEMPDMSEHELAIILGNLLKYSLMDFDAFAE